MLCWKEDGSEGGGRSEEKVSGQGGSERLCWKEDGSEGAGRSEDKAIRSYSVSFLPNLHFYFQIVIFFILEMIDHFFYFKL